MPKRQTTTKRNAGSCPFQEGDCHIMKYSPPMTSKPASSAVHKIGRNSCGCAEHTCRHPVSAFLYIFGYGRLRA